MDVCISMTYILCFNRGDQFRTAFAEIGELRSIIPSGVPVVALTATCTHAINRRITDCLSLSEAVTVAVSPERENITYNVKPLIAVEVFAAEIAGNIKEEGVNYPKTIIFCRTYQTCSMLYLQLKHLLGQFFTQPCGYPDLQEYRVVDMYTKASLPHMK